MYSVNHSLEIHAFHLMSTPGRTFQDWVSTRMGNWHKTPHCRHTKARRHDGALWYFPSPLTAVITEQLKKGRLPATSGQSIRPEKQETSTARCVLINSTPFQPLRLTFRDTQKRSSLPVINVTTKLIKKVPSSLTWERSMLKPIQRRNSSSAHLRTAIPGSSCVNQTLRRNHERRIHGVDLTVSLQLPKLYVSRFLNTWTQPSSTRTS